MKTILTILLFWSGSLASEPNLQVLVETLDRVSAFSNGITEARIYKKRGNIREKESKLLLYKRGENLLCRSLNLLGEEQWRILSKDRGNSIYFTKIPSRIIQKKTNPTRYENVPGYFFSFEDLSDPRREERVLSKAYTEYSSQTEKYWKVEVSPLEEEGYSKLYLYFSQKDNSPYRIDFYDLKGRFYKIIRYEYGEVNYQDEKGKKEKRNRISKIKSTDTNTGENSILEIVNVNEYISEAMHIFMESNFTVEREGISP